MSGFRSRAVGNFISPQLHRYCINIIKRALNMNRFVMNFVSTGYVIKSWFVDVDVSTEFRTE